MPCTYTQNTSLHPTTQKKVQKFNSKASQIVKEPWHFIQICDLKKRRSHKT
jgi:hypothetical protein